MTYALVAALVALVALVGYRLWKLRQPYPYAEARERLGLLDAPEPLKPSPHKVFAGPLEHNEHGFIVTPMVACVDADCHCRKMFVVPRPK